MKASEVVADFGQRIGVSEKLECLTCYYKRKDVDWLEQLQRTLEDHGVWLEGFCGMRTHAIDTFDVSGSFFTLTEDGCLCLRCSIQCVNIGHIESLLEQIEDKD